MKLLNKHNLLIQQQQLLQKHFKQRKKFSPKESPDKQYEFATSFLKIGDYSTAERAFREFVETNPDHDLLETLNTGMQKLLE